MFKISRFQTKCPRELSGGAFVAEDASWLNTGEGKPRICLIKFRRIRWSSASSVGVQNIGKPPSTLDRSVNGFGCHSHMWSGPMSDVDLAQCGRQMIIFGALASDGLRLSIRIAISRLGVERGSLKYDHKQCINIRMHLIHKLLFSSLYLKQFVEFFNGPCNSY